jgi:multisubunit Na+/H+ antiporter MnhB subunit
VDLLLQELITTLKELSPLLWETLMRQVYLNALTTSIWAVAGLVFSVVCLRICKKTYNYYYKQNGEQDYSVVNELTIAFSAVGVVGGAIVFLVCISYAIPMFINPQYYAIQLILENMC